MERYLGRFSPYAFALLRFMVGWMFLMHGTQKLFGWPPKQGGGGSLSALSMTAGVIEVACGILISIGFLTGWAAFLASGTMAFAYFIGHAKNGFWPIVNRGELAVVYCFLFLYLSTKGSGVWSVDELLSRKRKTPPAGYGVH